MRKRIAGMIGAVILGLVLVIGLFCVALSIERIPTGYVGVVYSMNGGVQEDLLTQGFHLVAPTKQVKEFTIGNEQLVLTKDSREGSEEDDSFMVSTADNANISISFQMSYRFRQEDVVNTYMKFRGMDGESIVKNRVRTVLKAKVSEVTTFYSMMDIYSGDRGKINDKITEFLNEELGEAFGIEVIDASIIDVHPDAQLQKTIDDRVTAMQKKQQAEAEQDTIRVQNETKIMQAEADAEAKKVAAQAEADIRVMEAEAEAEANRVIAASITPELIEMMEAQARLEHGWVTVQGADTVVAGAGG